ncbi:MAG: hypothetical protein ACYDEY_03640 [Acidimicrobiales bacterium]
MKQPAPATWRSSVGRPASFARTVRVINKSIVVIVVETLAPKGFGLVRIRRIRDTAAASLLPFVVGMIEPGSVVFTDD